MLYPTLKSFHLIGLVCWFAGLFYIVRLFIYDIEASLKEEPDKSILHKQLRVMQRRLWYGITIPSMLCTVLCGAALLFLSPYLLKAPNFWMHAKLTFVFLLLAYHFYCGVILKRIKKNTCKLSAKQLRFYNEIATALLCVIVLLVVTRSIPYSLSLTGGIIIGIGILFQVYSMVRKS